MGEVPVVSNDFKIEDYWQFAALSIEWVYVLKKLGDSIEAPDEARHVVQAISWDGSPIYMLRKKFYSAQTISRATGLSPQQLESHPIKAGAIVLRSKPRPDLPEATVSYWGEA